MKRTTIMLPDELDASLRLEAQRRGTTIADVVREAVAGYFATALPRPLSFIAIGEGDVDASERVDELVGDAVRRNHDAS